MKKGIYLALLTAVISGFSIFANKIFVSQADPLAFTTVRNLLVALMLTFAVVSSGKIRLLKSIDVKDWMKLLFIGIFGGGAAFALFFSGLSQIGAVQGSLIHKTLFLWVAFLALPFLKEKLHPLQIFGYLFIIAATFAIGGPFSLTLNSGAMMVLAATILWAAENIVSKIVLTKTDPQIVGMLRIILGLPVLILITFTMGKGSLLFDTKTLSVMPLLSSSLFLTGYILTWYQALKVLPASFATSILVISPIITNFLTAIYITHNLPEVQIQNAFLLALGATLTLTKVKKPQNQFA
jgi:drug/metabolite transporter (DMT)-like permease